MRVHAIHDESNLVERMPPWNKLVLKWVEIQTLPTSCQVTISQWRGIYLIVDRASGKSYVGSAHGDENILARWSSYGDTGHGGNIDLKDRDPTMFQFSILERVSPDLPADEVIRVEATWKERLGTREFGLNKNEPAPAHPTRAPVGLGSQQGGPRGTPSSWRPHGPRRTDRNGPR